MTIQDWGRIQQIIEIQSGKVELRTADNGWQCSPGETHAAVPYEGYKINTARGDITVGIRDGQDCCETFGHIASQDDLSEYEGADLKSVKITDTALVGREFLPDDIKEYGLDCGDIMFVTFETSRGSFQLAVYNSHNGYYGHEAFVLSDNFNFDTVL